MPVPRKRKPTSKTRKRKRARAGWIKSPESGRPIKVHGDKYTELWKLKKWRGKLARAPKAKAPQKRGGRSNVSKYEKEGVPKNKFCGPAGGAVKGSYPVNTTRRCSAALSYARLAPNPCGIARCVRRKCPAAVGRSSKLMRTCNN